MIYIFGCFSSSGIDLRKRESMMKLSGSSTISRKKIERLSVLLSLEFSAIVQYKFSVLVGTMF